MAAGIHPAASCVITARYPAAANWMLAGIFHPPILMIRSRCFQCPDFRLGIAVCHYLIYFYRLRIWPIYAVFSSLIDRLCSHLLLASKQHRHWFCENQQTLTLRLYKFLFDIWLLAGCRDCGLLPLRLLILFHMLPCELHMPPYYRWISRFSSKCRAHFCFFE